MQHLPHDTPPPLLAEPAERWLEVMAMALVGLAGAVAVPAAVWLLVSLLRSLL